MAQHYDVAVVGTQLAGVITAALLAKRGRRVILVAQGDVGGQYRDGGRLLPRLPHLLASLEQSPDVQRVHDELGIGTELRAMGRTQAPSFQAVLPDHRLDLGGDPAALTHELQAEFPELAGAMAQFVARLGELDAQLSAFLAAAPPLPPVGIIEQLRARMAASRLGVLDRPFAEAGLLAAVPAAHPLRQLLQAALAFFGHLDTARPSTFHAVRLLARAVRGAMVVDGGAPGLGRLLLTAARRAGVDVRQGASVQHIDVQRRRLTEMTISGERQALRADYFVSNTLAPFHELLPEAERQGRYVAQEERHAATGTLFVTNVVVRPEAIPRGMAASVLLVGRGEPDDPPVYVQRFGLRHDAAEPLRGRGGAHGASLEALCAASPVPVAAVAGPLQVAAQRQRLVARLRELVPYMDDYVEAISVPLERDRAEHANAATPGPAPAAAALHPLYRPSERALMGVYGRPGRTYYRNLVHCGRDIAPGLGLEGEYVAGVGGARTLQRLAGRAWF